MADYCSPSRREVLELLGAGVVFQIVAEGAELRPLGSRLHVAPDGAVTLLTGKSELGQGARTLLAQCVAEEMGIDFARVTVVMGDTALVPDDSGTFASLTTPQTVPVVRQAAAAAREKLRTLPPGELASQEIPVQVKLSDPAQWKVLGAPRRSPNARAMATGAFRYSTDLKVPGMLAGKVVRPEAYAASLTGFDASAAERLPGVKVVREGDFLGITAPDEDAAERAAALVKAEWKEKPLVGPAEVFEYFRKTAVAPTANPNARYPPLVEKGSVEEALAGAALRHEAVYTLPAIAHVPLEPRTAVASWDEKGLTVRAGSQVPFAVRKALAGAFGIPEARVRLIVSDSGGAFGGKHGPEVMLEAARLAKAAGKPVRVSWSREEEFTRSYCRPAGVIDVRSGLAADGRIAAWDFRNYNSGPAALPVPYAIPHHRCAYYRSEPALRQGPYRSLAAVANTFARESHVDELAAAVKADPVEFRLRNIEDRRLREAVERAAERFGWGKRGGGARGMACNIEKGAYMALFLELDADHRNPRVRRMTMVFDNGASLNPLHLESQVAGSLVMGIGGALFEELRYDRRKVLNPNLSGYRVPRFSDAPAIEVLLTGRRDAVPAGAGESGITVAAPAIAAALFAATGQRRRSLPLAPSA